jgi:hypothetical protein
MALSSKNIGGRPAAPIIRANFTVLDKVDNKSNCYWYKCNHCNNDNRIQGRDNNHVKHLTDPKACPNAPAEIRKEARIFLAGKGIRDAGTIELATSSIPENDGSTSLVVTKKWKTMTLDGFVDHPLTPAQQVQANVKLFRSVLNTKFYELILVNVYVYYQVCRSCQLGLFCSQKSLFLGIR